MTTPESTLQPLTLTVYVMAEPDESVTTEATEDGWNVIAMKGRLKRVIAQLAHVVPQRSRPRSRDGWGTVLHPAELAREMSAAKPLPFKPIRRRNARP
jgi:hypothetical protein